nr:MAG TPA: hypothetical protein [Bacteriophage sp.]
MKNERKSLYTGSIPAFFFGIKSRYVFIPIVCLLHLLARADKRASQIARQVLFEHLPTMLERRYVLD